MHLIKFFRALVPGPGPSLSRSQFNWNPKGKVDFSVQYFLGRQINANCQGAFGPVQIGCLQVVGRIGGGPRRATSFHKFALIAFN